MIGQQSYWASNPAKVDNSYFLSSYGFRRERRTIVVLGFVLVVLVIPVLLVIVNNWKGTAPNSIAVLFQGLVFVIMYFIIITMPLFTVVMSIAVAVNAYRYRWACSMLLRGDVVLVLSELGYSICDNFPGETYQDPNADCKPGSVELVMAPHHTKLVLSKKAITL
jgi:hypothetical protein